MRMVECWAAKCARLERRESVEFAADVSTGLRIESIQGCVRSVHSSTLLYLGLRRPSSSAPAGKLVALTSVLWCPQLFQSATVEAWG